MFLEEFDESPHPHHRNKQPKKEYSAGFRNYHPKKAPSDGAETIQNSQDDDLFAQLKIGNLKQLYKQSQPVINNSKKIVEEQMKSVMRLTMPFKNQSKVQENKQEEISEEQKRSMVHKFNETYHKEESFEMKAVVTLFKNQFKRIHEKLLEKTKEPFTEAFVKFFVIQYEQLQRMNKISNEELLKLYSNFMKDIKTNQDKIKNFKVDKEEIQHVLEKNMFLYGFYLLSKVKNQELSHQDLKLAVRTEDEFNKMFDDRLIYNLIDKKFTVPYDSDVARAKMTPKIVQASQQPQKVKLHANPIPKTTYEKPKERPKSHMSKTKAQPFNLTQNTTKPIDMNQFYKWDRTFHAQEVPPTTYKPSMAITMTEAEMKKRAQDLLKTSEFPATMTYLNDMNRYTQDQHEKLMKKYSKNKPVSPKRKEIPDFSQSHKNQLMQLEVRKEQNKHITEPKPFNLSHPRPPKPAEPQHIPIDPKEYADDFQENGMEQNKVRKAKIQPQSTLKYEAYVNHIKTTKEQKEKKKESLVKQQKKQQRARNEYQNILKNRIDDELNKNPKKINNPQALSNNQVKVNLEKIYQQEPLLIERQAAKSKKQNIQPTLSWTPII